MAQRFRKRPVVIQAVRFTDENYEELDEFTGHNFGSVHPDDRDEDPEIIAEVWDKLHSTWVGVKRGQWIIRGVQGEFYPCDADVFEATYEPEDGPT